jgi:hypothetical protein
MTASLFKRLMIGRKDVKEAYEAVKSIKSILKELTKDQESNVKQLKKINPNQTIT